MRSCSVRYRLPFLTILLLVPIVAFSQTSNATISGTVIDQTGAAIPGVTVTLTNTISGTAVSVVTKEDGAFQFPNLVQAKFDLKAAAKTFRDFIQRGIEVHLNEQVRVPITMQIGANEQTIEVVENASPLNFETPEVKGNIARQEIASLPLQVSGGQRSAAQFVALLPGVNPGGSGSTNSFNARFNGGQWMSDEAVLDSVSMVEGLLNQSGMVAIQNDFPISPDAVGEITVLTGNYDVSYGTSPAAVIVASTKEGTNKYHGGAYEFLRNEDLDAKQWGAETKQKHRENDFGAFVTAPIHIPWAFWSAKKKSYIFTGFEGYRSVGATTKPVYTVPTQAMRNGDFSEWPYPIYDPSTSRIVNGQIVRDQFMGCDGAHPNVICGSDPRLAASLAGGWLKYVPLPNRAGLSNNWEAPVGLASSLNASTDQWDVRGDQYYGDKDHFELTYHYRGTLPFTQHALPEQIDTNNTRIPNYSHIARFNWDHTFSPTFLNHFALGYLDLPTKVYNSSDCCVSQVPQIPGVYSHQHESALNFDAFSSWGGNADFYTRRPTWDGNDSITVVRGSHTLKFGAEYRNIQYPQLTEANGSGTFNFHALNTGILGTPSGNAVASFLLGYVGDANETYYTLPSWYPKASSWGFFASDQWKVTPKLTATLGLRYDNYSPSYEGNNKMSFLDPVGANSGAGGLPGRLAFAGDKWGDASYGARYPERRWNKGFGPRVGLAYAIDNKNVVRTGYGIFLMQNFYPGWDGGVATDGFNGSVQFSSTDGGLTPAFLLQNGFPQDFTKPPFIDSAYLNGQSAPRYRPLDANRLPYAQQWNFSVEHQFTNDLYVAAAYVGNKGTRLVSHLLPLNVLDPTLLSTMGSKLFDQFQPGQTTLDGVNIPYSGWVQQMTGCAPTVAQALVRYPQYCGNIFGQNENVGNSTYHSLQMKVEKRLSKGIYVLGSYTFSKNLTDAEEAQASAAPNLGLVSPYQSKRQKGLASTDLPQVLSLSAIYELPFGRGKPLLNSAGGLLDRAISGWQLSTIIHDTSGAPITFTSSYCNIPGQFAMGCLPGILSGQNPWAVGMSSWKPGEILFNRSAFEDPTTFNFYGGAGAKVTNLRGPGYFNEDLALTKMTRISERFTFEFRAEAFNVWNNHYFIGTPVVTDVASPSFGQWNGSVSAPRNLQVGGKFLF